MSAKCSTSQDFILEAKKHCEVKKEELIESDVKLENDIFDECLDPEVELDELEEDLFTDENYDAFEIHSDETSVKCEFCSKSFQNEKLLTVHMSENHSENINKQKEFKCQYCAQVFKSQLGRQRHENKEHIHLQKTCDLCKVTCSDIRALAKHLAQKHCKINEEGKNVFTEHISRFGSGYYNFITYVNVDI